MSQKQAPEITMRSLNILFRTISIISVKSKKSENIEK